MFCISLSLIPTSPVGLVDPGLTPTCLIKQEWPSGLWLANTKIFTYYRRLKWVYLGWSSFVDRPVQRVYCFTVGIPPETCPAGFWACHDVRPPISCAGIWANSWRPTLLSDLQPIKSLTCASVTWVQSGLSNIPVCRICSVPIITWLLGPKRGGFAHLWPARRLTSLVMATVGRGLAVAVARTGIRWTPFGWVVGMATVKTKASRDFLQALANRTIKCGASKKPDRNGFMLHIWVSRLPAHSAKSKPVRGKQSVESKTSGNVKSFGRFESVCN